MGANVSHTNKSHVIAFRSSSRWKVYLQASKQISKLKYIQKTCEFVKIDVDHMEDVAKEFGVEATPTFILLKNGKEVDRLVGAKTEALQMKIENQRMFLRL